MRNLRACLWFVCLVAISGPGSPYAQAADGALKWAFYTQGVVFSSPAVAADGTVYVGSRSRRIWAINPNGSLKWRFPNTFISALDWFESSPAVADDGTIYAACFDGRLYALNPNGTVKWIYATQAYFASSPAIGTDGTIYLGGGDGLVHALNPNGTLRWSYATGDWVDSSPAIGGDGTIYVGSWDKKLYALNPDGTLKWSYATGDAIQGSPAIGPDGTIYIGSADKQLHAVRPDGTKAWSFPTGDSVDASPVVGSDGTVYFGSADGFFYALRADGTPAWPAPYNAGQGIFGGAVIRSDGTVLFGTSDRALHALNGNGTLKWKYLTGDVIDSTPAVAPDGTIYVGSYDGSLHALAGEGGSMVQSSWPHFRADARQQGRAVLSALVTPPSILTAPAGQSVPFGAAVTFSVEVGGTQPLAYQWIKDGADIAGATSASLVIGQAVTASAGTYTVRVTNTAGSVTSADAVLVVGAPVVPSITLQPRPLVVVPGARLSLWVVASGSPTLQYQWTRDGVEIAGATGAFFEVDAAAAGDAGSYRVTVTNAGGSIQSDAVEVRVEAGTTSRLVNLSTRARLVGGQILIPGFVVSGTGSRRLLVRAVGPTLTTLGVPGAHPDPQQILVPSVGATVANDNWGAAANAAEIAATATSVYAFALPAGSLDSALLADMVPGSYTVHVSGVTDVAGVVLVELYDAGQVGPGDARLANISARGDTGEGEAVMIPGFTLEGAAARTLLIRAVGPSLSGFGVADFLPNPKLTLFQGQTPILEVDNWTEVADVEALVAASGVVYAFALEENSVDAAMLVVLMPGSYTAHATGIGVTSGNVLVEIYEVP
jgi:outer membrane protein assembly factor BamB